MIFQKCHRLGLEFPQSGSSGRRGGRLKIVLAFSMMILICPPVRAQSRPAAPAEDSLESQALLPNAGASSAKSAPVVIPAATFDTTRVILALAGVLGLIFLLRAGARRIFPGGGAARATSAVKVLARCTLSPKQHLLVIQFGKRLLLVGDTGTHLNPLCEIADADEASGVLAQARDESISAARRFDSLFGRARGSFGGSAPADADERFDDSHDAMTEDPCLEATRKELEGLSDKVRDVVRQLGRA
jgi:flagellar biogenesis protein FliO